MSDLEDIVERIIGWTKPSEAVEAYATRSSDTDVVVHGGDIESFSSAQTEGIGIRVLIDQRQGFAFAGSLDDSVVREALQEARDNATFTTADPGTVLAVPDGVDPAKLQLWDAGVSSFAADDKVEMALQLERMVRKADSRIRSVRAARYGDGETETAIASTTGIRASTRRSNSYVAVDAIAVQGDDTQTGTGYSVARNPNDLDPEKAGRDAVERATRLLGAHQPKSGRMTVVLDNQVTPTLLGIVGGTMNGEAVLKGRSLFSGRLGERIASELVTLVDDPTQPDAYAASPYDAEGLACRCNELVSDGELRMYLYDTQSAHRAGARSTGSAVRAGFKGGPAPGARALSIRPGSLSQQQLIAEIEEGVLVQAVSGVHSGVNPVSGDFSVGAEGLMIRNGELAEPLREMTIASTLQKMLLEVRAVGGDVEWLPGIACGVSLVVGDVTVSGS